MSLRTRKNAWELTVFRTQSCTSSFDQVIGTCSWNSKGFAFGIGILNVSAYRNVFLLCATSSILGAIHAITIVLQVRELLTSNALFSTWVSLLVRNGMWTCFCDPSAFARLHCARLVMHSFSTLSDLLISRVSAIRSFECWVVSKLASLPARSTSIMFPSSVVSDSVFKIRILHIECDREDSSFLIVVAVDRSVLAILIRSKKSLVVLGLLSTMPFSCMLPNASS